MMEYTNDSPAMRELKAAAFETLMLHPGISFEEWRRQLLRDYTEEVIDALGDDGETVMEELDDLWHHTPYFDPHTELVHLYPEWAQVFKTKLGVEKYQQLIKEINKDK